MKKIRVGFIGLGQKGYPNVVSTVKVGGDDVVVTAVCDIHDDRCDKAVNFVFEETGEKPFKTHDYKEVIHNDNVDVVILTTNWETHIPMSIEAMKAGKIVGVECGGATSVEECMELVKVYEETKTPIMFLENCCYTKEYLMVQKMVREGLFGQIVHCHGAYSHDLRDEVIEGKERRHYRLDHYLTRNGENYPTHELGPIAKIIDINRGNRMVSLVSVASKAASLEEFITEHQDIIKNKDLIGKKFTQGDIISTIITCANGETITLTLDTTLPKYYSREVTIRGTKGMYNEDLNTIIVEKFDPENPYPHHEKKIDSAKDYEEEYSCDYWKNITEEEIKLGHGGLDRFIFGDFFNCIRKNKPFPIDVYDAAAWMAVTPLSEESIAKGGVKVDFPDFTNGAWKTRERLDINDI